MSDFLERKLRIGNYALEILLKWNNEWFFIVFLLEITSTFVFWRPAAFQNFSRRKTMKKPTHWIQQIFHSWPWKTSQIRGQKNITPKKGSLPTPPHKGHSLWEDLLDSMCGFFMVFPSFCVETNKQILFEKIRGKNIPGDSKRPCYPLVGGHLTP